MKVMVLGAAGMLGHKIVQHFSTQFETIGTVRELPNDAASKFCFSKAKLITDVHVHDIHSVTKVLDDLKPDVVINCIGIIKQLKESKDALPTLNINAIFPKLLATLCQERQIRLVHFSTDCVFNGRRGNYTDRDLPDCEDLYGISKFLGEVTGPGCLTIRTSIIGRELRRGVSLIEWFLSQKGGQAKGYLNAQYSGLTTNAMAELVARLLTQHPKLDGLWQVSSDPINKFDLLQIVNRVYKLNIRIEPDEEFKCDRRLDSTPFRAITHFKPASWEDMIQAMHADPTPYSSVVCPA